MQKVKNIEQENLVFPRHWRLAKAVHLLRKGTSMDTSVPKYGEGHVKASQVTPKNNRNEAHANVHARHDESSSTNQSSRSIPPIEEEPVVQLPEGLDSLKPKKR